MVSNGKYLGNKTSLKKSLAQKIFGSNISLKNRRIEFTPTPPYASLREARLNFSENNLVAPIVALYSSARGFFEGQT
jgi:hypothetical protein